MFILLWLDPMAVLGMGALRLQWVCSPVFHCHSCPLALFACPIGVVAHLSAIHVFPFLAIGTLLSVGALFGTFICGWVCPFGFLQDLTARIPTPKFHLPGWMGYSRYVVLMLLVLLVPYFFGLDHPLFICRVCPAGALEAAVPYAASLAIAGQPIIWPSMVKITILVLFVVAMFFTWRPWCTLFCPLGAIYSLSNRASFLFLRFHPQQCKDCDRCRTLCHSRGPSERRAGDLRCIRCLDCTRCKAVTVGTALERPLVSSEDSSSPPEGEKSMLSIED
jgi:ferredoxin-type protein NapH